MNKKQYFQHFMVMFSGTVVAQLVNFLSYPFLARHYTPEDFGEFTVFLTTVAILGAISCGRYDAAIQAAKYYQRFAVYRLSQYVNVIVATLSASLLCLLSILISDFVSIKQCLLMGIAIYLTGYCNSSSFFLLKHEEYKLNAASQIARTLLTALPQVGLYYIFPNFWGLIIGFCLGFLTQAIFLNLTIKKKVKFIKPKISHIKVMFSRYSSFLKSDVLSQILSVLSLNILNYLLLILYSNTEVGYYSMAYRMAALPLALFSSSLAQVFFQKASKSYHLKGSFWPELKFNLAASTALSVGIFTVIFFIIKPIIVFYLGKNWLPVADIIIYLSPMLGLRFISISIATAPLIYGRPKVLLINNCFLLLSIVGAFFVARYYALGINEYLILTSSSSSLVYIIFILYITESTRRWYSGKIINNNL